MKKVLFKVQTVMIATSFKKNNNNKKTKKESHLDSDLLELFHSSKIWCGFLRYVANEM